MIKGEIWQEKRYNLLPGFILDFIRESTLMNEEEYKNWREIKVLLKQAPNAINKYLKMLKADIPTGINRGVENIMTKSTNQNLEKIADLLPNSGMRVVHLIADGVPRTELANSLQVAESTLKVTLREIYKRTSSIIKYSRRNKFVELCAYILGTEPERAVIINNKDCDVLVDNLSKDENRAPEEISTNAYNDNTSAVDVPVIDNTIAWHSSSEILQHAADFLLGEYTKMCTTLGQLVIDDAFNPCAVLNTKANRLLAKARKYQSAIDVINDAISNITKEGVRNV